jgi:uncharacterized tellurite resistance protein B-like protein
MLNRLQTFFDKFLTAEGESATPLPHRLQLASAALMVEVLHADDTVLTVEENELRKILEQRFELSQAEVNALIELAHDEKHAATDYYAFTSLLNEHYSQQQKIDLVEDLWRLAFADDRLDRYEEHLLRRLAELLHVPHTDFIRTKHMHEK